MFSCNFSHLFWLTNLFFQDKDRDNGKNQNGIWHYLMGTLSQLATTEKSYMSLLFLVPKSFLRKENSLKISYESLRMECKRTEEFSNSTSLDLLVVHLLGQLAQFLSSRLELIELYVYAFIILTVLCSINYSLNPKLWKTFHFWDKAK